jgi:phosphoglycolate phosphatase-like HAD superfamily hydrolase
LAAVTAFAAKGVGVVVATNNSVPGVREWLAAEGLIDRTVADRLETSWSQPCRESLSLTRGSSSKHFGRLARTIRAAVFVGDSLRIDGQAAERAGVPFVHFDPPGICHSSEHHHVRDLDDGELRDILRV